MGVRPKLKPYTTEPINTKKEKQMVVIELIVILAMWLASGYAISKIYDKAGFKDTPKFVFWLPALNLAFLLYLAFSEWPEFKEKV